MATIKNPSEKQDSGDALEEMEDQANLSAPSSERISYERKIRELTFTIESLESEIDDLRRRLNAAPSDDVEVRLYEMTRDLMHAHRRNRKLTGTLQEAKEKLEQLKEKVEQLSAPPNNYGVYLQSNDDGTLDIDPRWQKVACQCGSGNRRRSAPKRSRGYRQRRDECCEC